jgi:ribonuclease E
VSSVALQLLRSLEEMLLKGATHNFIVRTRTDIALYLLNNKRGHLRDLEQRFQIAIMVNADATIAGQVSYVIEKGEQVHSPEQAKAILAQSLIAAPAVHEEDEEEEIEAEEEAELEDEEDEDSSADEDLPESDDAGDTVTAPETASAGESRPDAEGHRRRRRRRGRGGEGRKPSDAPVQAVADHAVSHANGDDERLESEGSESAEAGSGPSASPSESRDEGEHRRRRRGRRGGRRNRRDREGEAPQPSSEAVAGLEAELGGAGSGAPAYVEPLLEQREAEASRQPEQGRQEQPEPNVQQRETRQEPASPVAPPAQPAESAPPRRRSTVREPAPGSFSAEPPATPAPAYVVPAEPPQPATSSEASENEDSAQPRRSGWWSRRVLGKG